MALIIKEKEGVFYVHGNLNVKTASYFQKHMEILMSLKGEITINIDHVKEINEQGVATLKQLYMHALVYNRALYITGNGCEPLYHDFRYRNVA